MLSHRLKPIHLLLLFTLLGLTPTRVLAQAGAGQFLLISDIHFDSFYDERTVRPARDQTGRDVGENPGEVTTDRIQSPGN